MKHPFLLSLGLLVAGIALALNHPVLDPKPGAYLGQTTVIVNQEKTASVIVDGNTLIRLNAAVTLAAGESLPLQWDGVNWIAVGTQPGLAAFSYDFPNVAIGQCKHSTGKAVAILGAKVGEGCVAGSNFGADGGDWLPEDAELSCEIGPAGFGHVNVCSHLPGDAGTGGFNLPDAGFFMRAVK